MWRVVFSPRWLAWHLLAILAVAGCVIAAIWQWSRAGSAMGSALNVGYGIQWPLFAVFFGYMWWRFLRQDLEVAREHAPESGPGPEPEPELVPLVDSPFTRSPVARVAPATEKEAPALSEYNRMLAALAERDSDTL
ncbi:lipoprotein [Pseudonocardia ailaonensis]|uniref:Lipoprotein n=1 Tax=Pseudonocardia ailaonensis TaxID=367279 RepID=A0ABN2NLA5_9PSEU